MACIPAARGPDAEGPHPDRAGGARHPGARPRLADMGAGPSGRPAGATGAGRAAGGPDDDLPPAAPPRAANPLGTSGRAGDPQCPECGVVDRPDRSLAGAAGPAHRSAPSRRSDLCRYVLHRQAQGGRQSLAVYRLRCGMLVCHRRGVDRVLGPGGSPLPDQPSGADLSGRGLGHPAGLRLRCRPPVPCTGRARGRAMRCRGRCRCLADGENRAPGRRTAGSP